MLNFDESLWEKKVVKIFKALSMMERFKYLEPHFSKSFGELAQYLFLSYVIIIFSFLKEKQAWKWRTFHFGFELILNV